MKKSPYLITVFAALATFGWAGDKVIIVESFSDGLNSDAFSTPAGKWSPSVTKSTAEGLTASKSVYNDADNAEATARFAPDVPVEGKYEVFITYAPSGNAKGVIHKVVSSEGEKQVLLDQNGRTSGASYPSNTWHSLGVFSFAKGTGGYVEVSDPMTGEGAFAGEPNKRIYADAIRLIPQGFELPADYVNKPGEGADADVAARTGTFLPAVGAAAPAAATTSTASAAPAPGAPAALPNLPGTASAPPALPSLPGAAAVATGPASTPASAASPALPSLPPATGAASAAAGLPSLPGAAPIVSAQIPALPASTAASGAVAALPSLPGALPTQAGLPSLPSVSAGTSTPAEAVAALPRLPQDAGSQATDASTALPALPENTNATPSAGTPAVPVMPGLPSASVTPAPDAVAALPGLPPAVGSPTPPPPPGGVATLPSLLPATPTPARTLPSVNDTPAAGYVAPAPPTLAAPPMVTFTPPPPSGAPVPGATGFGTPAPAAPAASSASATWSLTSDNPANLQWTYDFGAALNMAAQSGKKVMVFFTAKGNRTASRYENEFFTNPSVRALLDQMVLVKVDFPRNTRLAYSMGVFGAGIIAVTDQSGRVLMEIDQIPASPQVLIARLQNPTAPAPEQAAPASQASVPAAPAAPPADPAAAAQPADAPVAPPADPAAIPPPPPAGDAAAGLPALPPG